MKKLNMILVVIAAVILVGSGAAFAYSLLPKGDTSKLIVDGKEYSRAAMFNDFDLVELEAGDEKFEGVAGLFHERGELVAIHEVPAGYLIDAISGTQPCSGRWRTFYDMDEGHRARFRFVFAPRHTQTHRLAV